MALLTAHLYNIKMKKFRFDPLAAKQSEIRSSKKLQSAKQDPNSGVPAKEEVEKQAKKSKLQRQIEMLNEKISATNSNIKQTEKLLDIDLFLKKEKQKRLQYAKKLNEEYEHGKKERERKLYKQNRNQQTQRLPTGTINSEVPLGIFGAFEQIQKGDNPVKKWILEDHYHKLDEILLDKTKNDLLGDSLTKVEEQCLKGKGQNSWRRAKEVASNSAEIKYFPATIGDSQLEPSDEGETLISVLTLMPPALSEHLYQQNIDISREQYFLLRFFAGGQKKSVLTDERIQVREFVHKFVNVNSRAKDNLTFWSTIIEKGFKKLYFKQQKSLSLPEMCQTIYGIDPQIIPLSNKITITANFPKVMTSLLKNQPKALIGLINERSETRTRIYPLVNVHHPRGQGSRKGNSKQVTDVLYQVKNPYAGKILSSNYINKFTINELFEKFTKIVLLRELPKKWCGIRIFIEFMSNGPISFTGNSWTQNSQYSFTLAKPTHARIALRRRWGSYSENPTQLQQSIFGFLLFKSQNGETEVSCLKLQFLVSKVKSTDEEGCIYGSSLQKGTYILIPYSNWVSQQYMQLMNLDIFVESENIITVNKSKVNEYFYQLQGEDAHKEKVAQKLQVKNKYEKPKWQKLQTNKIWFQREKNIDLGFVEGLGLTLMNGVTNEDYFIPGSLKKLLVNGEVKEEKRDAVAKKSAQSEEIERYERQQALNTLLGYDILMGEDINYGEMRTIVQETADEIDLANYCLGQQGFMGLIEALMLIPRIVKLDLSHNELNDSAITYLCYYLEKGSRNQLRELNVTGNQIGKMGAKALKGLASTYQQLKIIGVKL